MLINMSCFRLDFVRQAHISIEYLCQGQYLKQGSRKVTVSGQWSIDTDVKLILKLRVATETSMDLKFETLFGHLL